jgi:hypothetical protein
LIWQSAPDLLEMGWSRDFGKAPREKRMKRTGLALLVTAALAVWMSLSPAHAVPPTATPSPGYDARLQEQRAAQRRHVEPMLNPAPKRRGKKAPAH